MTINMIAARFAGRPLAIAPRALEPLLAANSLEARPAPAAAMRDVPGSARLGYVLADGGIAVVPVVGPLLSRGDWLTEMFGIMSYADVADAVDTAFANPAASAVLLEVDSPGGEVGGLFDLVEQIREARASTGKPLWAVASESALSAGYAIASIADRIYVTRTGEVGSIGVVAAHVDESAADAMAGQKWTLIQAGAKKTAGNPHEPLAPGAFAEIQTDVDALYADFVALVAANRGIVPEAIRSTEAAIYRGKRALAARLADRIGTVTTALFDLKSELDKPRTTSVRGTRVLSSETRSPIMTKRAGNAPETEPEPEPPAPATPSAVAPPAYPASAEPPSEADRLRAEYSEIASIAAQAARLGVVIDAADAMKKSVKPDALRCSILDALAARSEASTVVAAAPQPAATPGTSPIVRRARERAASGKH